MTGVPVRRAQPWLGTLVTIECVARDGVDTEAAIHNAFAAIGRVHRAMSRQEPASDVARFNAADQGASIDVDAWTADVMRRAERLRVASGGVFDVALGSAQGVAYRFVDDARGVTKLDATARLDLGGIAKGYAVDRAIVALRAAGVRCARVNAGGDLRAIGAAAWPVTVRDADEQALMHFDLVSGAVATSTWLRGCSPFHRDVLVAPGDQSVRNIDATITVAAPNCALADALTKVVGLTGDINHPLVRRAGACAWLH